MKCLFTVKCPENIVRVQKLDGSRKKILLLLAYKAVCALLALGVPQVILLILFTLTCGAQTNSQPEKVAPPGYHTWTFKKGGKFVGKVAGFSGANIVILTGLDGTNRNAGIPMLVESDQELLNSKKASDSLSGETRDLEGRGYVELTEKTLKSYPEKVDRKPVWMDGVFQGMSGDGNSTTLKFNMRDKNGDYFSAAQAAKETGYGRVKMDDKIQALNKGDKVRLFGTMYVFYYSNGDFDSSSYFEIDSLKVISHAKP